MLFSHQFVRPGREAFDRPDQLAHVEGPGPVVQQLGRRRVRVPQLLLAAEAPGVRGAGRTVSVKVPVEVSVVFEQRPFQAGGGSGRLVVSGERLPVSGARRRSVELSGAVAKAQARAVVRLSVGGRVRHTLHQGSPLGSAAAHLCGALQELLSSPGREAGLVPVRPRRAEELVGISAVGHVLLRAPAVGRRAGRALGSARCVNDGVRADGGGEGTHGAERGDGAGLCAAARAGGDGHVHAFTGSIHHRSVDRIHRTLASGASRHRNLTLQLLRSVAVRACVSRERAHSRRAALVILVQARHAAAVGNIAVCERRRSEGVGGISGDVQRRMLLLLMVQVPRGRHHLSVSHATAQRRGITC